MREGSERAVRMATERADTPYQAFGQERIAQLSENERLGIEMARQNVGRGEEDFGRAREALGGMTSFTDEGVAEQYMNPYMEQVVAPGLRRRNEAFEAERAKRQAGRGMQDAFGGRGRMWEQQFQTDFQREQDEYMGAAYGSAYESAAGLHATEQGRAIQQASAYGDLAYQQAAHQQQQLRDLMGSGLVERTREQADLDFQYIEHLERRDWDVNNLSTLVQTLAGVPSETTQKVDEKTVEKTKPNAMKMVAGVAMIAAGVMTGGAALAPMVAAGGSMFGEG